MGTSIWDIDVRWANFLYNSAYVVLVIGSVLTVLSTMTLFWTGGIRDKATQLQIDTAQSIAETARRDTETLRHDNLTIQQKLEAERTERLKLELEVAKLQPRLLDGQQIEKITRSLALAIINSPLVAEIAYDASCTDCNAYSAQFADAFSAAGWQVVRPTVFGPSQRSKTGLLISSYVTEDVSSIYNSFRAANILFEIDSVREYTGPVQIRPSIRLLVTSPSMAR